MGDLDPDPNRYRCVLGAADEPLGGTAAVDPAYLLIEHPGPWGHKALAESRLPSDVRAGLAQAGAASGVRIQLIRRHGRATAGSSSAGSPFRIFLGYVVPGAEWVQTGVLDVAEDLLDLDLDGLAEGRRPGLAEHDEPLFLVCTNGRRDACCAELGRPVAATLAAAHPENTWETSHLGGHRFAGAMLTLPHGLSYGRLDAVGALGVAEATLAGRIGLAHLRGRSAWLPAVQAAEIALRHELGEDRVDALTLVETSVPGDVERVDLRVRFQHHNGTGTLWEVDVRTEEGPEVRASCADTKMKATKRHVATILAR